MRKLRRRLFNAAVLVRETLSIYSENEMPVYAGYTTLYILMAMVPLLTLLIGIVNLLPDLSLQHLEGVLGELLPDIPELRSMVHSVMTNVDRQRGSLAVSVSALVLGLLPVQTSGRLPAQMLPLQPVFPGD